jgi:hypothetical protein
MSRSLSILGRSHIANSLLLSKLWHILRVLDPPTRWLKQCERATRNYACPYGYKPSWRTICGPKNQSGAAVIDIQQQSQALKMIHLQTCADAASTSFLPQVLRSIFRAHTGHASLLTLFLLPREMIPLLRHVPPVQQLARIITRIPMMRILESRPSHLLTQIPLRCTVQRPISTTPCTSIMLSITVGDCMHWDWYSGGLMRQAMSNINDKRTRRRSFAYCSVTQSS